MFAQHIRWLPAVVLQYVAPAAVRPLLLALGSMAEQGPYLNWIDLEAALLSYYTRWVCYYWSFCCC